MKRSQIKAISFSGSFGGVGSESRATDLLVYEGHRVTRVTAGTDLVALEMLLEAQ